MAKNLTTRAVNRIRRTFKSATTQTASRHPRDSRTDRVHVYTALGAVPETFGGLTVSALRRTSTFTEHGNPLSVTIMVFAPDFTATEISTRLLGAGLIKASVIVRVLWDELREMSDQQLRTTFTGTPPETAVPEPLGNKTFVTKNHARFIDGDGETIRQEHYRDDGTLIVTHIEQDSAHERVILHTADEEPLVEWGSTVDLYIQWTRHVIVKEPAILMADGARIASIAHKIRPRNFKLAFVLHISHLKRPADGIYGQLVTNRLQAFQNHDQFDIVAVQTQQQIDDMAKLGFTRKNMRLLPSELPLEAIRPADNAERDESKGLVIARLVKPKQIDHAIDAVTEAKTSRPGITLDIAGTGTEHDPLQQLINERDLTADIHLLGHVNNVADRLAQASFSLLTSKFEGLGLAIIESMATGCIPITYDIKYGPTEIITNGINGYVVPADDTSALAEKIVEFLSLPADEKLAMREAAVSRAKGFLPEPSYARWKAALEEPVKVRTPAPFHDEDYLRVREAAITTTQNTTRLGLVFADRENVKNKSLRLVLVNRSKNNFFHVASSEEGWQRTDGRSVYNFTLPNDLFSQAKGHTFNVYIRKVGATWDSKLRLKLPVPFASVEAHGMQWYRTEYGNFSVKCFPRNEGNALT